MGSAEVRALENGTSGLERVPGKRIWKTMSREAVTMAHENTTFFSLLPALADEVTPQSGFLSIPISADDNAYD